MIHKLWIIIYEAFIIRYHWFQLLRGSDGWVNCPNDPFTRCYGIAGMPGYENPDISNGIGGVEYLIQVIEHIESKLTSCDPLWPKVTQYDSL